MTIEWSPTTRKKLHGFRHRHTADPKDQRYALKDAWKRICRRKTDATTSVEGRVKDKKIVTPLLAELEAGARPTTLDPTREMYRAHLVLAGPHRMRGGTPTNPRPWNAWAPARALVSLWAETEDFAFVLDILHRPRLFDLGRSTESTGSKLESYTYIFKRVSRDMDWEMEAHDVMDPLWWALRAYVSELDDEALAQACKDSRPFLRPLTKTSSIGDQRKRARLLFVLSRNPELAGEGIEAYQRAGGQDSEYLVAAAPDARTALTLLGTPPLNPQVVAYDIVEAFGEDAAAVLAASVDANTRPKQYIRELLSAASFVQGAATPPKAKAARKSKPTKSKSKSKSKKGKARTSGQNPTFLRMELQKRGKTPKFWESSYEASGGGFTTTIRYGDIGTEGQLEVREFATEKDAYRYLSKPMIKNMRKGYKRA